MPRLITSRKARLKAALALEQRTLREFASELGVTVTHVYLVLCGERTSPRIDAAVDVILERHSLADGHHLELTSHLN